MIHCWVMQHELWGLFNRSWMRCSTEMCYIFSSLVYTVKGTEKKYLKHQEVKSNGLQSVGWKGVVYFFLVRLIEKYLQFTRGTITIQVQSMFVLFPVAKYWLCLVAADGLNGECRPCWKEWVSVRATSGPSCAQWTWLLHQAASLELAGALGAFCHSSHCLSASPSHPSFATVPRLKDHIMCCVGKFCTSHRSLCILLGSPIRTWGDFILPGENYDVVSVQNVHFQPQLTAGFQ